MPDFNEEQYEFILIDLECDGAADVLVDNEAKLTNYHWILLDMQSTEVSSMKLAQHNYSDFIYPFLFSFQKIQFGIHFKRYQFH